MLFALIFIPILLFAAWAGHDSPTWEESDKKPTVEDKMQPDFHSDNPEDYL